ncbi:pilus assembly protein TadG-related protein [Burkholderia sp. SCN-KJ]|uniref:pilus assembly protein TadG-related protein n=1 Tax=Burkholderia sp. SCN-KJ TaxID=2969248 RepID=UPI0021500527|nr:pilus assembly protein TadG-related protein [Burkholderia sp. SCN-KJ]MCR4469372.1 pilus assembly protein TadG-related protein [Burkholderia sp. SCN-KJ]
MRVDQPYGSRRRGARRPGKRRQRGSIVVMAALWVTVAIVVLGVIDIANLYLQKRDLQRVADLAALAAVQPMSSDPTGCLSDAKNNVTTSANINDKGYTVTLISATATANPTAGRDQIAVSCGRWDPSTAYVTPASAAANAAQVTAYRQVSYFFLGLLNKLSGRQVVVSATATARAAAIDTFSVGSTLASLNSSSSAILDPLLTGLLGASANVNVGLASYQALAGANITLGQLANVATQLGTAGMSSPASVGKLLGLNLTVADILNLTATAVGSNTTVGTVLTALKNSVGANVNANKISLGSLLQYSGSNAEAAANASINVLQLLLTTAEVGAYNSALTVSVGQGNCPGSPFCPLISAVSSLVRVNSLQLQVLAPPSIGIGEAGQVNGIWRTQASQAEIGLYVDVQALSDPPPLGIPGVLTLQLTGPHLPLYIILGGPGRAWLANTSCQSTPASSTATFGALPGVAMICAGQTTGGKLNLNSPSCASTSGTIPVAKLSGGGLLGNFSLLQVVLSVSNPVAYVGSSASTPIYSGPPLPSTPGALNASLSLSGTGIVYQNSSQYSFCNTKPSNGACTSSAWSPGPNWTTSSTATNTLNVQLTNLLNLPSLQLNVLGLDLSILTEILQPLTGQLIPLLLGLVNPLLNTLVTPLLTALGLQIGQLTVIQHGLTCNAPQIVH